MASKAKTAATPPEGASKPAAGDAAAAAAAAAAAPAADTPMVIKKETYKPPPEKQTLSEAMERLLKPSLKEQGNALNVAQIAMLNLEQMIQKLQRSRAKAGETIAADKAEVAAIDAEVAKLDARLTAVKTNCGILRAERDQIDTQLETSKKIFHDAVMNVHKMINQTNSNVARLGRTQVPKGHDNFLKSGKGSKASTLTSTLSRQAK